MDFPDYTSNSFHLLVSVSNFPTYFPPQKSCFHIPSLSNSLDQTLNLMMHLTTFCETNQTLSPFKNIHHKFYL